MPLSAGDKLGPYEILAPIGAGGMGEVYRSRDTKLNREVAIKVLPPALAQHPDRLARFEREARVLAALNHPNIAMIHGLEDRAIVMELVDGPTLADRIRSGAIPLEESLKIAAQIADAFEAAHDKGVVHRDLKPANVKVREDGTVKVLDFGLATAVQSSAREPGEGANSPTLTMGATESGVILGTAAYMSPEQAAGKPVDRRADIWSFGVVLWEMLTGKRLFDGETVSHTLADVLRAEIDFAKLPRSTPSPIRELLKRCLDRDLKTRLRDIGEARIAIQKYLANPNSAPEMTTAPSLSRFGIAAGVLAIALAAISWLHLRETPPEVRVMRTFIPPPDKTVFNMTQSFNDSGPIALSPDGRRMVFSARTADGKNQLWIRPLDAITPQPLAGTEGATMPFWSPDSRYVGFFSGGKLKKIDTSGGPPLTLCDAPAGRGGTWNQDGVIVFAPDNAGLLRRVSAAGGVSSPVTSLDRTPGANSHRVPWFLPDGRHFFYLAAGGGSAAAIYVGSLDSKGDSKVIEALSNGIYSQGHLLFLREDTLMAQLFDVKRLSTTGEAVPIAENVRSVGALRVGVFSVSENGLMAYQAGGGQGSRILAWFDRSGKQIGTLGDSGGFVSVHFSPDQKSVAVSISDLSGRNNSDIWLYDVARGLRTRFTFDPDPNQDGIWSPDGSSIVFDSTRKGPADLYRKASSGAGTEELLYADKFYKHPKSWSPDGKFLLYSVASSKTGGDIWILPLAAGGERKPIPFAQTPFNETNGQFSPDDRWIAYQSDESQRPEIYVAPFNGPGGAPGGKRQISTDGGSLPRWRRDGKEIFYLSADGRLMAAEVNIKGASVEVGAVRPLFGLPVAITGAYRYDVSADGQRFLAITEREQTAAEPITLVQNWAAVFKK